MVSEATSPPKPDTAQNGRAIADKMVDTTASALETEVATATAGASGAAVTAGSGMRRRRFPWFRRAPDTVVASDDVDGQEAKKEVIVKASLPAVCCADAYCQGLIACLRIYSSAAR